MSDILNLNQIGNRLLNYLVAGRLGTEALRFVRTWTHSSPPRIPYHVNQFVFYLVGIRARAP